MLAFTKEEYQERLAKTKKKMEERGIDLLIINDPANICYLTGLDGWSFYVYQMALVSLDDDQPYLIQRLMDRIGGHMVTWLDDEHLIGYPDYLIHNLDEHIMDFVGDFINEKHLADGKMVATEKDCFYFPAMAQEKLAAKLVNAKGIIDAEQLVNWVKLVKTDSEIAMMRKAAAITTSIHKAVYAKIAPGVRQCDAAAEAYAAGIRGTEEYGGEFCAMFPFMACDERQKACHLPWTDEPYREGQSLMFEYAGVHKRYHVPTARTICVGKASDEMQELAKIAIEALNAALSAAKAGNLAEDVPKAWAKVVEKYGIADHGARMGYSIGLNFPPDWGERTISFRHGAKYELQENMCFHCLSDIGGYGVKQTDGDASVHITEGIRITDKGGEPFADLPRELIIAG